MYMQLHSLHHFHFARQNFYVALHTIIYFRILREAYLYLKLDIILVKKKKKKKKIM